MPNVAAVAAQVVTQLADVLLAWGWLFLVFLALWIAWETYLYIKHIDYVSAIQWTYLQVRVPEDSAQTPKSFENAVEVWGGIHKDPDLIEKLFEGYFLPWYSCEIQCLKGIARYIIVVPTGHAKFMEGVIYGQYPTAEVREVEDYSQMFTYQNIEKTFDMWGSEVILAKDDFYPIRLYREFEDTFAEDDRFVDPHQALIETFTNINEGEHFWVQILVKPMAAKTIDKWAEQGQEKISELSGSEKKEKPGWFKAIGEVLLNIPGAALTALLSGPQEAPEKKKDEKKFKIYNPSEDAEMKGILQKVSRAGFKVKIRVMHFAPVGKLHKPNYGKAIGVFKQFSSFQLNQLKPDGASKTNGPNYVLKQTRRRYRKRKILLDYQQRDFWGDTSGDMMSAEEIATLYHFPIKYVRSPAIERATSGLGSPPENLPYI
jgi:hypothetical protein